MKKVSVSIVVEFDHNHDLLIIPVRYIPTYLAIVVPVSESGALA